MVRIHYGSPLIKMFYFDCLFHNKQHFDWPLHLAVRILDFHSNHRSSSLLGVTIGRLAQLVERYPYKVDVRSSSLLSTTILN